MPTCLQSPRPDPGTDGFWFWTQLGPWLCGKWLIIRGIRGEAFCSGGKRSMGIRAFVCIFDVQSCRFRPILGQPDLTDARSSTSYGPKTFGLAFRRFRRFSGWREARRSAPNAARHSVAQTETYCCHWCDDRLDCLRVLGGLCWQMTSVERDLIALGVRAGSGCPEEA
jgi:hypothetical protein